MKILSKYSTDQIDSIFLIPVTLNILKTYVYTLQCMVYAYKSFRQQCINFHPDIFSNAYISIFLTFLFISHMFYSKNTSIFSHFHFTSLMLNCFLHTSIRFCFPYFSQVFVIIIFLFFSFYRGECRVVVWEAKGMAQWTILSHVGHWRPQTGHRIPPVVAAKEGSGREDHFTTPPNKQHVIHHHESLSKNFSEEFFRRISKRWSSKLVSLRRPNSTFLFVLSLISKLAHNFGNGKSKKWNKMATRLLYRKGIKEVMHSARRTARCRVEEE